MILTKSDFLINIQICLNYFCTTFPIAQLFHVERSQKYVTKDQSAFLVEYLVKLWEMLPRFEILTTEQNQYIFSESFGILVIWQILAADETN